MADSEKTDRSRRDDRSAGETEPSGAVLDLRGTEPLVDLHDAPSVRFMGPPPFGPPAALRGNRASGPAGIDGVERRDAIQRARYVAVVMIAVLNVFDLVTTYVAISLGAHEGNPIVAWMISSRAVVVVKVLVCGALVYGAIVAKRRRFRVSLTGLCVAWAVVGIYSLVVLINTLSVWSHLR